jgi:2-oxoglutarate ferredoxin oxidoreductase subunit delta
MKRKNIVRIDKERCKGCNLCITVCSRGIVKPSKNLNLKGFHYAVIQSENNCTGCKFCAEICPDAAIEIDLEEE